MMDLDFWGLYDRSRFLGVVWKGKTCIIAKFPMTDLFICSHSKEGKTLSYSRLNTVALFLDSA